MVFNLTASIQSKLDLIVLLHEFVFTIFSKTDIVNQGFLVKSLIIGLNRQPINKTEIISLFQTGTNVLVLFPITLLTDLITIIG